MHQVFTGNVATPGGNIQDYLKMLEEAEKPREPFRNPLSELNGELHVLHNKEFFMLKSKGFTIIEVLIVVAILGILAAIAIPQVTKYTTNARRADGKTALLAAAHAMERYYTNNYNYGEMDGGEYKGATIPATSEQGYYSLNVTAADDFEFTIEATAQGRQASDTTCLVMEINQLGEKSPPACW